METKQPNLIAEEDLQAVWEHFNKVSIWHNLHFETLAHTVIGSIIGIIVSYCMGLSLPNACFCTAIMVPASYARQYIVARFFGVMRRRCK